MTCPDAVREVLSIVRQFYARGESFLSVPIVHRDGNITPFTLYDPRRPHPLTETPICLASEHLALRCRLCVRLKRLLAW